MYQVLLPTFTVLPYVISNLKKNSGQEEDDVGKKKKKKGNNNNNSVIHRIDLYDEVRVRMGIFLIFFFFFNGLSKK